MRNYRYAISKVLSFIFSILKNRDDAFGKVKRRSTGEEGGGSFIGGGGGKNEHVRIRSPSLNSRGEHVRIRTPSPEEDMSSSSDFVGSRPSSPQSVPSGRRGGRRSRTNSCREGDLLLSDDGAEIPSILKRRRASADDLGWAETAGGGGASSRPLSPAERASILKRKSSFGSNYSGSHSNYSGRNSPDVGSEGTRWVFSFLTVILFAKFGLPVIKSGSVHLVFCIVCRHLTANMISFLS
jgi:hypothetical protein